MFFCQQPSLLPRPHTSLPALAFNCQRITVTVTRRMQSHSAGSNASVSIHTRARDSPLWAGPMMPQTVSPQSRDGSPGCRGAGWERGPAGQRGAEALLRPSCVRAALRKTQQQLRHIMPVQAQAPITHGDELLLKGASCWTCS